MSHPWRHPFKARLGGALGSLVWWEVSLPMAGGWNRVVVQVPSNPSHSAILWLCGVSAVQGTTVWATSARDTGAWITTAQLPRGDISVGATSVCGTCEDNPGPPRAFPVGAGSGGGGPGEEGRAGWGSSRQGKAGQGRAGPGRAGPYHRPPPPLPARRTRPAPPGAGSRGGGAGGGRRGGAAMGGAALSGALWLGLLWAGAGTGAGGGCSERCCEGRDAACVSSGWREDGGYGSCYCDGGCRRAGDCCHDHGQVCPALPCVVGEWSHWSGCAEQCKPNLRLRRRYIQQEPKNGGEPCPALEEKAGCLEYLTHQGQDCGHEHVPAFITTSEYGKERKRRAASSAWSSDKEEAGYCVEFKTESLSHYCALENRPYARWMQYLREGHTVCVACQPPAMNTDTHRCSGDGHNADGGKILRWEAVGNSRCQGTWKKIRQLEQCSCPLVHSFIFT
uniref:Somatomedin B and thrombospondin type 1 domain containing n=1 Tax=Anser brachyrhynchus TaxID=132585 RepID=A0A8B9BV23_9AVES